MINLLGLSFRLFKYCGAAYFDLDLETGKLKPAGIYYIYMMHYGVILSQMFPLAHAIQIYLKLHPFEEYDDDPDFFAKLVISWAEFLLGLTFFLLNTVIATRRKEIMYLYNQLLEYNKRIQGNIHFI